MRQQSVPAVGDVIRLDGVTKTCPARLGHPGEIARLEAPGTPVGTQMLDRFAQAGSYAQIRAEGTMKRLPPPRPGAITWDP
jgi:hypothetical protein